MTETSLTTHSTNFSRNEPTSSVIICNLFTTATLLTLTSFHRRPFSFIGRSPIRRNIMRYGKRDPELTDDGEIAGFWGEGEKRGKVMRYGKRDRSHPYIPE